MGCISGIGSMLGTPQDRLAATFIRRCFLLPVNT